MKYSVLFTGSRSCIELLRKGTKKSEVIKLSQVIKFSTMANTKFAAALSMETINPQVTKVEYAVRGPIVIKASELENELAEGVEHPFERVIKANIGDCQAVGQKPITFIRQVVAACTYPPLIEQNIFPSDVNNKCKEILDTVHGSVGCYSDSVGLRIVREHVAEFIAKRDGYPCDPKNLIITNGASSAVKLFLSLFASQTENSGVMIPIPQYPLYSATVDEFGMHQIGYYLNEKRDWGLDISELKRAIDEARKTCNPRVLCMINPGNPTGQVYTYENIKEIIKFAIDEGLVLCADEVYQDNVYREGSEFHSFKKVYHDMGAVDGFQLASFHSTSKGFMGECGLRGGYVEIIGLDDNVHYQLNKLQSAQLGSNIIGQVVLDCVVKPPKEGDPSYELFMQEKNGVLSSLKTRANLVYEKLNQIEGITCNEVAGAMYAFPRIYLPEKAIEKAKSINLEPDFFYCLKLLEETGICVVPGSGFRQEEGTYHFRMTILPPLEQMETFMEKLKEFNTKFRAAYSD